MKFHNVNIMETFLPLSVLSSPMNRKRSHSSGDCLHSDFFWRNETSSSSTSVAAAPLPKKQRLRSLDEFYYSYHQRQQDSNKTRKKIKFEEKDENETELLDDTFNDDGDTGTWISNILSNWPWSFSSTVRPYRSNPPSPLFNQVILNNICGLLSVRDLKACRQVSKFWKEQADPHFRKLSSMEIDMTSYKVPNQALDFWNNFVKHQIKYKQTPSEEIGIEIPSENIRIVQMDFKEQYVEEILKALGGKIKSLSIDAVAETSSETEKVVPKHFITISENCPNLETLELHDLPDNLIGKGFPKLMKTVMQNINVFQNLKRLVFHCPGYYCPLDAQFLMDLMDFAVNMTELSFGVGDDDALEEIFTAMEYRGPFMKQVKVLQFTNMFGNTLYEDHIQTLLNLELHQLHTLEIGSLGPNITSDTFFYLLNDICGTLKVLKLGEMETKAKPPGRLMDRLKIRFPCRMNQLVSLEIEDIQSIDPGSIPVFLKTMPNLRRCFLNKKHVNKSNPLSRVLKNLFPYGTEKYYSFCHHNLTELSLPPDLDDIDVINGIKFCFPSLKRLWLNLSPESQFSGVVQQLADSKIEELHLKIVPQHLLFESALSGIPSGDCETLMKNCDKEKWNNAPKLKVWKTFADWKHLRKLSLLSKSWQYYPLTDVAILHGFALAKNLTSLELCNFMIEDFNLSKMIQSMSLTQLALKSCKITPDKWKDCRLDEKLRRLFPTLGFECNPPCPLKQPQQYFANKGDIKVINEKNLVELQKLGDIENPVTRFKNNCLEEMENMLRDDMNF